MNKYELLYILAAGSEDNINSNIEKYKNLVEKNGGAVEKIDRWGMKRFAYPINFKNEGYYVLMNFECDGKLIAEIDRQMRINDDVYRQMFTRLEE